MKPIIRAFPASLGLMQGVVISPDDASLVKGAPALRRRFLDMHIAQLDPHYVRHLSRYYRAMKQRNFERKRDRYHRKLGEQMALSAVYIIEQRLLAVSELQECIFNLHRNLTGEAQDLIIQYEGITHSRESLLEQYKKLRPREAIVGSTLTGPHRDDFQLIIGSNDTRRFASEGQQRSCVAALMFAKWERIKKIAGLAPMMLIDDVGMSL